MHMGSQILLARYGLRTCELIEYDGPFDMDISSIGISQANELATHLQMNKIHIKKIFCSPFRRAIHTSHVIAKQIGAVVCIENGLTEWLDESLVGYDEYKPFQPSYYKEEFPLIDLDYKSVCDYPIFPEAEEKLIKRTEEAVNKLVKANVDESILLISHAPCILGMAVSLEKPTSLSETSIVSGCPLGGCFLFDENKEEPGGFKMMWNASTEHMSGEYHEGKGFWNLPCMTKK
eukprot:TRINITY_DN776179_c0_g1_i1.p1 TRINITY_DN776179_c0_g1~~TRINITY_DN776179_c0_g1_i1.p1  ORF type:complete len:233 (-),score=45.61 TRINITY_DN776179_c0_g1_i1:232-930(-)